MLAELDKIDFDLKQIANHANTGTPELDIEQLRLALGDVAEMRRACLQFLGYERHGQEPEP